MSKQYRITKTDSRFLPLAIEERYTLFLFLHWWNTPHFAPPHRFRNLDDAINRVIEEVGKDAIIDIRTDIIKKD
jgi:myo-inositol catabolism protein IolC